MPSSRRHSRGSGTESAAILPLELQSFERKPTSSWYAHPTPYAIIPDIASPRRYLIVGERLWCITFSGAIGDYTHEGLQGRVGDTTD